MDPGGNSDSEEESVSGSRGWEVVASDPDSGLSDSNCDVQMHDHGVTVLPQHFLFPPAAQESRAEEEESSRGREPSSSSVKDWIEPSRVIDERQEPGQQEQHHRQQQQQQQHDLDLLSTLISSVLESEKREAGGGEEGEVQTGTGEEASLASLHREIVSESGFSALVPSDLHGNVLRPEEQDEGEAIGEDEGDAFGFGEECERRGGSWKRKIVSYIRRASTLWSLTIAAALMGLVIIGQRWQHERWQNHQLRLQLCYKDEKISQLLFQIARLKETVTGRRRVPVIKASSV